MGPCLRYGVYLMGIYSGYTWIPDQGSLLRGHVFDLRQEVHPAEEQGKASS